MCTSHDSNTCECCAESCSAAWWVRETRIGMLNCPPDMPEELRGRIEHLIEREEGKVPGHELDDRTEPNHGGPDAHPGKPQLRDWRIDDAHFTEFLE